MGGVAGGGIDSEEAQGRAVPRRDVLRGADTWRLPADPQIAKKYYGRDVLYAFNGVDTEAAGAGLSFEKSERDRPVISNLFDTFVAVSSSPVLDEERDLFPSP